MSDSFNSDGDGWIDGKDGEPLDAGTHEYSAGRAATELVLGFTLGAYAEENHDNVYCLIGSSLSGIVLVGDIRDAGVYISQGDKQMATICLIGLIPTGGDGARYISKIGKEMAGYSTENAAKVSAKIEFRRMAVEAIQKSGAGEVEKVALLDEAFLGLGTRVVRAADGVTADDVLDLVGDEAKNLKPTKMLRVVKHDTTTVWLEEGFQEGDKRGLGWIHIKEKHITGEVPGGDLFPTSMTEDEIKNLICGSVRYGVPEDAGGGRVAYIYPVGDGRDMRTIVDSNRGIITSYPVGE